MKGARNRAIPKWLLPSFDLVIFQDMSIAIFIE